MRQEREQHKKQFRDDGVLNSLKTLGDGLAHANAIQIKANVDAKIVNLREAIGKLGVVPIHECQSRYVPGTESTAALLSCGSI
jgi:hypothetical protein